MDDLLEQDVLDIISNEGFAYAFTYYGITASCLHPEVDSDFKDAVAKAEKIGSEFLIAENELPKKPTPPTRPDEPPVGTFFRVDRRPLTTYRRVDNARNGYICVTTPSSWLNWNNIVDLGDTIKMLELREVEK